MNLFLRRALAAIAVFVLLVTIGSASYMRVEGAALEDAIYMTVITLTAVGYQEVFPLSPEGRALTMGILFLGITWMGTWFALITSFLVELDLTDVLRSRRMSRRIEALESHVIVCGAGRTGRRVVDELERSGAPWVVIEHDEDELERLRGLYPEGLWIQGDATHDDTLIEAGLDRARGLVSCLTADTDNLFVCLSARDLRPDVPIVARASESETMDKLYRAGATHVVSPILSGGTRMASVLLRPSVVSFLDIATHSSEMSLRMEQMQATSRRVVGQTLADAKIPQETGLIVIAVRKEGAGDGFHFNPASDTRIEEGDDLIVLGTDEQIDGLREYLSG